MLRLSFPSLIERLAQVRRDPVDPRRRRRYGRASVFTRRSWLPTVTIVLLTGIGGAAQLPQQQSDRPSTPSEVTPGQAAAPRLLTSALQGEGPQAESASAPTIGGIVSVGLNVEISRLNGANGSGSIPPDTDGAVGPRHIVEMINGNFEVIDKTTGASIENRSLFNFWTVKVGVASTNNNRIFDPKIFFDPSSGRWFATSEDNTIDADNNGVNETSNNFYIARTDTDDPTGDWDFVVVAADTVGVIEFHDYPQVGLDADGLFICTQDFDGGGNESCYSIPKADLLLPVPTAANLTRFEATPAGLPATAGSWQPSLNFGLSIGRMPLLGSTGTALQRTTIFGATAAFATLGAAVPIAGDPGHAAPPAARQPDDSDAGDGLETIENVAPRFVAPTMIVGDSLWAVHAVQGSGANSALRWYQIRESTNTILQTGLIDNPNVDFHEPSIAVNEFGHVVIGYTCSGPNLAASVCASVGTTTAGVTTFQPPAILFAGSGTYYQDGGCPGTTGCAERNRWGDYSSTVRDPLDPATFWVFQEYTAQDAGNIDVGPGEAEGGLWGVRAVELTFNELTGGDVAVVKTCEPSQGLLAGQTGFCEISVTNYGPGSALNVVLTDRYLSNGTFSLLNITTTKGACTATTNPQVNDGTVTCNLGRMPANGTALIHVDVSAETEQTVNDTAKVTSDSADPDPTNNEAHGSLFFAGNADLSISKTDSPDPVVAGQNLTYALTVTNNGPSTAVNVVVSDLLSASLSIVSVTASNGGSCNAGIPGSVPTVCTFSSMVDGAVRTMTIIAKVDPSVPAGTILSNNATVTSQTADANNLNNLDVTHTTVTTSADLAIVKTDSPDPVIAGANLTYGLTVTNLGPSWARDVVVSDTLPTQVSFVSASIGGGGGVCSALAGSPTVVQCSLGDIANGGIREITIQTTVSPSVANGTVINNAATVSSTTTDPVAGNNSDSESTTVNTQADIWIDKVGEVLTGNPSRTVRYTLTVYNKAGCEADDALSCGTGGPSDAQNVVVTDHLPLDPKKMKVVFVSQGCIYDEGSHTVTCTVAGGTLPAGQFASFIIDVQVAGSVGTVTNAVSVATTTTDPNQTNNTDVLQMIFKGGSSRPK